MNRDQAIHNFFSQFLTAYDDASVPDDALLPYLTYPVLIGTYDSPITCQPSLWYKDTSWEAITLKAHEIMDNIDGHTIKYDKGAILLNSSGAKYQRLNSGAIDVKRILLTIQMTFLER